MQAKDVMTAPVVTVGPDDTVREIAELLLERRISAVPVAAADNRLVGIVSEGDLVRRPDSGTEPHRSWWLALLAGPEDVARDYIKSHGYQAKDVMTAPVRTVGDDASLEEVASVLERYRIKRVPVVRDGRVVGIVSRANLLHGLAAGPADAAPSLEDHEIRDALRKAIQEFRLPDAFINIVVSAGHVQLWGAVRAQSEKRMLRIAAENLPGVKEVQDEVAVVRPGLPVPKSVLGPQRVRSNGVD